MTAGASSTTLQRLAQTLRTLGPLNGPLYLSDRALSMLTGGRCRLVKYRVVAQPVGTASALPLRVGGASLVEEAIPGHVLACAYPRPPTVIASRYASGARCLVASVKSQFAGYLWWQRGHYDEDEVRCRFVLAQPDISSWDFDVYVEPRYRLGRTLALLWKAADQHMQAEGVRWTFSRISSFNAESLASHSTLGAVPVAHALFFIVGSIQISLFDRRPFADLSIRALARPSLSVGPPSPKPSAK